MCRGLGIQKEADSLCKTSFDLQHIGVITRGGRSFDVFSLVIPANVIKHGNKVKKFVLRLKPLLLVGGLCIVLVLHLNKENIIYL